MEQLICYSCMAYASLIHKTIDGVPMERRWEEIRRHGALVREGNRIR